MTEVDRTVPKGFDVDDNNSIDVSDASSGDVDSAESGSSDSFLVDDGSGGQDSEDPGSISESYRREIRTFVIRAGRMTDSEKRNYSELNQVWCIPFEHRTLNLTDVFGNTNPVTIEIGFGMGHATAQIAHENPEMNYLGLEVHKPGVGRLLGEIKAKSISNLYIIEHDALEVLEVMVPDSSVEAFHVFFPDPWPKKKHHKRRLMRRPRTDLLAQKLTPSGFIYFATDIQDYAEEALEELSATEGLVNRYEKFAPHQEWRPRTKFEQKGLDAGREIYELIFEKAE